MESFTARMAACWALNPSNLRIFFYSEEGKQDAFLADYRYCEKCMMRTEHEAVIETRDYNPRGRGLYRCKRCGRVKSMRHLRPSSEIGY